MKKKLLELSENVKAIVREKEQLAAKSAMHDGLAASLTVTKQYLAGNLGEIDIAVVLHEWEKSIAFRDAVLLSEKEKLFDNASSSGVSIQIKGKNQQGVRQN